MEKPGRVLDWSLFKCLLSTGYSKVQFPRVFTFSKVNKMVDGHEMGWFWRLFLNTGGKKGRGGDWLSGPHTFPSHWPMLPKSRLPQRARRLPATLTPHGPSLQPRLLQAWRSLTFLLRTLLSPAVSWTSLRSLPKCPFPRQDFPVKKKRSSLPSVKNSAPTASKHSLCLAFTAHHSRLVLACKFSICLSQLDGRVSESWELFHSLLNPQNVDQHPAHSSCAINFC